MVRRVARWGVVVLALALPAGARAQGIVPGGWAPTFGYQAVVGPGVAAYGASASYGYGLPGVGMGYSYGGYGSPYGYGVTAYPHGGGFVPPFGTGMAFGPPANQTFNGMNPLINSVRQTTRKRRTH
jgi:hypothetical protein